MGEAPGVARGHGRGHPGGWAGDGVLDNLLRGLGAGCAIVFSLCDSSTPCTCGGPPFSGHVLNQSKGWSEKREGGPFRKASEPPGRRHGPLGTPAALHRTERACSLPRAVCTSLLHVCQSRAHSRCLINAGRGLLAQPKALVSSDFPAPWTSRDSRVASPSPLRPTPEHLGWSLSHPPAWTALSTDCPSSSPRTFGAEVSARHRGSPEPAAPSALPAQALDGHLLPSISACGETGWKFPKGGFFSEK